VHERYEYLVARFPTDRVGALRRFLVEHGADGARDAGVTLWGAWLGGGSIGWHDDEVILMLGRPADDDDFDGGAWLAGATDGLFDVAAEALVATVRPADAAPLAAGGVQAHRWFELHDAADFDELLTLSAEAWPAFEAAYDARIEGFFRATTDPRRVLLVTRYASVAEWERSRQVARAEDGELADARRRFVRRRELTRRQVVRVAPNLRQ
jgi:hypothetical protein